MRKLPHCGLVALLAFASLPPLEAQQPSAIVLGIADGTSQELLTAARIYSVGAEGKLALESLPQTAIMRTFSASDLVTDSSAGATAFARGIKADNRVVGQAAKDSSSSPPSLLDLARNAGWSTAVITDDSVTGGTPSPFLVESPEREKHAEIAAKMVDALGSRADIVLGGGSQWFSDRSEQPWTKYKDNDKAIATETGKRLRSLPVDVFDSWDQFVGITGSETKARPILGTFAETEFPYFADGARKLRLLDMVQKTVEILRARGKPFLIIFEAALPDKACHLNNAKRAIVEVLEFDATLAWLKENLGPDALIIGTTDHNNGGFTINGPPTPIRWKGDALLQTNPVTGQSILTWSSGPGFDRTSTNATLSVTDPAFTQPALLPAKSAHHSGGDVWLLGAGPGSERIRGFLDNTDVYKIIADAITPAK